MRYFGCFVALVALVGCGSSDPEEASFDASAAPVAEGSAQARALLRFVNHTFTDHGALRGAGVLTNSAAAAVLEHRHGADGVFGSPDDDLFDSVAEVDAVKGIGPATIANVAAFALANGYGTDRGLYHGVYFTEKQAKRTLSLVNEASIAALDEETSVDRRALANIEAARPIVSLEQLAALSRVRSTALRLLREHADRELGAPTCGPSMPCATGLFCTGGSTRPGRCVDTSTDGEGDPCGVYGACGEGLLCAARNADFEGICVAEWMHDEYVSEIYATLPDGPNGSVGVSVDVMGLATVPTDAILRTVIAHDRPADLELILVNPIDTETVVWPAGSGPIPHELVVGVPGDEPVNGLWTLTIRDTKGGAAGAVSLFALELTSRWD
jgi:hypothetical protein